MAPTYVAPALLRSLALLPLAMIFAACSAEDTSATAGTEDSKLVDSELRVTSDALANELQWVDKQHALVGPNGTCRYVPPGLVDVDAAGRRVTGGAFKVRDVVQASLARLIEGANASGARVSVLSAYRDFDTQVAAYGNWRDECVSAYPGHSEHQLGTTVDLQGVGSPEAFSCTTNGATERWIVDNAHTFGFTVSYPKCNGAGYRPEPWHLRWVGADVAMAIFRARTSATLAAPLRASVSPYDFFACHGRGSAPSLPFVTGHVSDPAAPNDLLRTPNDGAGLPASTCTDAGRRYFRPAGQCLDYCAGQGNCSNHDLDAICAVFPRVSLGSPAGTGNATPSASPPWDCGRSRYGTGQVWTCSTDGTFRAKCDGERPVREACSAGCVGAGLGRDDTCR